MRIVIMAALASACAMSAHGAPATPARDIVESCLAACTVLGESGTPINDLASVDRCMGYFKGLSSAMDATVGRSPRYQKPAACAAVFLKNRTARSPQEDPTLHAACRFGRWGAARPTMASRPAVEAVSAWMATDGCASN